jgi:son of sevenless-like protein
MFLTDLVHVNDQFPNLVDANGEPLSSTLSLNQTAVNGGRMLVNFVKLQRFSDVINNILKFSSMPYILPENPNMLSFIDSQLATASSKDQGFFWQRSQDLLSAELAHADIRKGLEAAGF